MDEFKPRARETPPARVRCEMEKLPSITSVLGPWIRRLDDVPLQYLRQRLAESQLRENKLAMLVRELLIGADQSLRDRVSWVLQNIYTTPGASQPKENGDVNGDQYGSWSEPSAGRTAEGDSELPAEQRPEDVGGGHG